MRYVHGFHALVQQMTGETVPQVIQPEGIQFRVSEDAML